MSAAVNATSTLRLMLDVMAGITSASELPEGWFEQGSPRLSDRARAAAFEFVYLLATHGLLAQSANMDVIPTPIGGIQFEWAAEQGEVEVEINADGQYFVLVERSDGSFHETPRSAPLSAAAVLPHIERALA